MLEKCELLSDDDSDIYRFKMQAYEKMGEIDKAIDEAVRYLDKDDNPSIGVVQDAVKKHLSYGIAKVSQKVTNDKDQKSFWMFVRARFYEWQHNYPKPLNNMTDLKRTMDMMRESPSTVQNATANLDSPGKQPAKSPK